MASIFRKDEFAQRMVNETLEHQKKYKFDAGSDGKTTYNNEADAFKHAYMQWSLSTENGKAYAYIAGEQHEFRRGNDPGEKNMDRWNNAIGREVFSEMKEKYGNDLNKDTIDKYKNEAADRIMIKMKRGEMIIHPSDSRIYENMEKERLKSSDRVYYKGELNTMDEESRKAHAEHYMNQAVDNKWKIPAKEELDKKVASGDMIYVDNYTRADGTKVSGYNRRRPTC